MRAKTFRGSRCTKRKQKKCEEIARTYDKIQTKYAEILDRDENIKSIRVNVVFDVIHTRRKKSKKPADKGNPTCKTPIIDWYY